MKKNVIRIIIIFIILILFVILYFLIYSKNKTNEVIEIDNNDVVIINNKLNVFDEYKISDIISINEGTILNNRVIDTNIIGEKLIEVFYLDRENVKKKAFASINIVDDIKPTILGGSNYYIVKGSKLEIEYIVLSFDNYTSSPKREIVGNYNLDKIGKYNLTFKITDESGNENTKDFTLNIISKKTPIKPITTKTFYDDIVKKHKNDSTMIGLDVSEWQGTIDFDKLKEKNVEFIFIRIGFQRGFKIDYVLDSKFERNIKEANRVGIPVGLYFYSYATSKDIAKEQALWIIERIKDYKISLPIAFDFEDWSSFSKLNLSQRDINDIAISFIEVLEKQGYKGMNYSSKYYLENIWNIEKYPTWLANYTSKTNYQGKYSVWQLCQDGRIDGINGAVDINVMYDNLIY